MDDEKIKELADYRLQLEQCRHRRTEIQVELERRRAAAEIAQRRLEQKRREEIAAKEGGKTKDETSAIGFVPEVKDRLGQAEDWELLQPLDRNEYRLIEEHLNQRQRQREEQALEMANRIKMLNQERYNLQIQQAQLVEKRKKEAEEAQLEETRIKKNQEEEEERLFMEGRTNEAMQELLGVDIQEPLAPAPEDVGPEPARMQLGGKQVGLEPARLDATVQKVGLSLPQQRSYILEMQGDYQDILDEASKELPQVPEINPKMTRNDLVTQAQIDQDVMVWAERGEEINKRLRDEAFQKAIRLAMKQYLFEVVDLMSADIAAEAAFSRFWAERTAAGMIMNAMFKHPDVRQDISREENEERTKALRGILREFQTQRFQNEYMHVHNLPTLNAAEVQREAQLEARAGRQGKKSQVDRESMEDVTILTLYSDIPRDPPDDLKVDEEVGHWDAVEALPIFFTAAAGVSLTEPSPNANMLAVVLMNVNGITIYDIRHLPPLIVRKAEHDAVITSMVWSDDSSSLATLDNAGNITLWAIRLDQEQKNPHLIGPAGEIKLPTLIKYHRFQPLVDQRTGQPRANEVDILLDISDPSEYIPTHICWHPSVTILGRQPCVMAGLRGGSIVKLNTTDMAFTLAFKCEGRNDHGEASALGEAYPELPAREYYVRHLFKVIFVSKYHDGSHQLSVDERGFMVKWYYHKDKFSQLGWFIPEKVFLVNVADAVHEVDKNTRYQVVFPNEEEEQWEKSDPSRFREASVEHGLNLRNYGITEAAVEETPWKEGRIRARQGVTKVYEEKFDNDPDNPEGQGRPPGSAAGSQAQGLGNASAPGTAAGLGGGQTPASQKLAQKQNYHTIKYDSSGMILQHLVSSRTRKIFRGVILKCRMDHTQTFLVVMGYLVPTSTKPAQIVFFRVDLLHEKLAGARINLPVPAKYKKAIDAAPLEAPTMDDVDFDVAPPIMGIDSQVIHVLLDNKIHSYSLTTGIAVLGTIEPLKQQARKATLNKIRICSKFHHPKYEYRHPPTPPPPPKPGHPPVKKPIEGVEPISSFEYLVIVTARESPVVYAFSFEIGDDDADSLPPGREIFQGIEQFSPPDTPSTTASARPEVPPTRMATARTRGQTSLNRSRNPNQTQRNSPDRGSPDRLNAASRTSGPPPKPSGNQSRQPTARPQDQE